MSKHSNSHFASTSTTVNIPVINSDN